MSETETTGTDEHRMSVFFDIQSDLPRQGPGDPDSTRRALAGCSDLPVAPRVLDIGCGPGAQTMVLAESLPDADITAVDFHQPYLDELRSRAASSGLGDRIHAVPADMHRLPFPPGCFDLVWAEGSAYSMGVANALATWKPLLKDGGFLAITELVWLADKPPTEAADFFSEEYPAMTTIEANTRMIDAAGYRLIDHFTLPDAAWWRDYYTPLAERLPVLEARYAGDEAARQLLLSARTELAIRRKFPDSYGYEFFVSRKASVSKWGGGRPHRH